MTGCAGTSYSRSCATASSMCRRPNTGRHRLRALFRRGDAAGSALQSDGLIDQAPERITLTARGRLLMRNVAMAFDAYVSQASLPSRSCPA